MAFLLTKNFNLYRVKIMWKFTNLPTKNGPGIECKRNENSYTVQTSEGWIICEIETYTDKGAASDIASAIRFARDAGYEQALADIRRQLGIKT